ncbi:hypothetical protein [Paenibacillus sp. FJAT-27812]|uniref:hypothetical protein n=1 Tax=Paenibacillus sp. FJAT-27812 TaxID=1684143 RepID=UPI0006A7AFC7|nr:hypothetical protein [Paenibacillus sp. FJAT-27812]
MIVYGCDFSGAKDPNGKIYVAVGNLEQQSLTITEVIPCEDRLDLFSMIKHAPAPWGLDFPFSVPKEHLANHYQSSWRSFIHTAYLESRMQFKTKFGKIHSGKNNTQHCRLTDIAADAKSPIAETPISMNGMVYGGRKLLFNLLNDAAIYPFDAHRADAARLYEVYPSHGWSKLGLNREDDYALEQLDAAFKNKIDPSFSIRLDPDSVPRQPSGKKIGMPIEHATDAIMACMILAYSIYSCSLDDTWGEQPPFAADEEWSRFNKKG